MDIKTAAAAPGGAAATSAATSAAGAAGGASGDGSHRPSDTDAGDPTAAPAGKSDVGPLGASAAADAPTTAGVGAGVAADGAHGGQKLTCPAAETSAGSTAKAKRRTFYLGDRMRVASTAKGGPDHGYDICFNFLRHAFDTLLLFFLGLCSPALRVILDVLGLGGGVLKYGLYGMAIFLVSVYGLSFVFTLMRTYIVETSIVFAVLQCLVLAVSLRNIDC